MARRKREAETALVVAGGDTKKMALPYGGEVAQAADSFATLLSSCIDVVSRETGIPHADLLKDVQSGLFTTLAHKLTRLGPSPNITPIILQLLDGASPLMWPSAFGLHQPLLGTLPDKLWADAYSEALKALDHAGTSRTIIDAKVREAAIVEMDRSRLIPPLPKALWIELVFDLVLQSQQLLDNMLIMKDRRMSFVHAALVTQSSAIEKVVDGVFKFVTQRYQKEGSPLPNWCLEDETWEVWKSPDGEEGRLSNGEADMRLFVMLEGAVHVDLLSWGNASVNVLLESGGLLFWKASMLTLGFRNALCEADKSSVVLVVSVKAGSGRRALSKDKGQQPSTAPDLPMLIEPPPTTIEYEDDDYLELQPGEEEDSTYCDSMESSMEVEDSPACRGRRGYRPKITKNPSRRSKVDKVSRIKPGSGNQTFIDHMKDRCTRLRHESVMGRISHEEAASKYQVR